MPDRSLPFRLKVRRREWLAGTKLGPLILNRYPFAFEPSQLHFIADTVSETAGLDGAMLEVGCNTGAGTVYIKRHMKDVGIARHYYCIDTFTGFTPEDIAVERGRGKTWAYSDFDYNSKRLFELTLAANRADADTTVIQADAATFDYSGLPPLAFALLDVDLFRPMAAALAGTWPRMVPGGIIIVDDCDANTDKWDGGSAAYLEFCEREGLTPDVRLTKLGVLRKPL
ncbi:MAG TPA: class I SAM-dependent methyltransferase [Mycobacteriales bacterium]|nr:class I SAM-dependent methyltransferase [Mycobacteriales bacterium]